LSGKWPECQRRLSLSGQARTENALVKIYAKINIKKLQILKKNRKKHKTKFVCIHLKKLKYQKLLKIKTK